MTDRARLLDALRALDGVADAAIVDDERGVGTLRLTLGAGADEVDVALRVNRVLRDRFGLAVDSGKVQVVEESWAAGGASSGASSSRAATSGPTPTAAASPVDDEPTFPAGPGPFTVPPAEHRAEAALVGNRRLAIRRLQLVSTTSGISTAVSLGLGARTFVGEAEAGSTPDSVQRAVALATLRAIDDVLDGRARVELVHAEVAPVADEWVAVVVARLVGPDGATAEDGDRLTGAAVVREDVRQAVIRATLDAVNRRVERVLAALDH
jgi:hypothetical protein